MNGFPRRIYTVTEFEMARNALAQGYRHRLKLDGSLEFKNKIKTILKHIRSAGYYDFLRTYIRKLCEVKGLSQLREADATIWLNRYVVENSVEGARFIIQKTEQMKEFLDGNLYYNSGESRAVEKSIIFLEKLRTSIKDQELMVKCEEVLKNWKEAKIV